MAYKHLKERSHYEDLYDSITVERCRWHEQPRPMADMEPEGKKITRDQIQWFHDLLNDEYLFQYCGNRYLKRAETIDGWMKRDEQRDAKVEGARRPLIRCPTCGKTMECFHIYLNSDIHDEREWLEFFLECKPCKQRKRVFENGTEIPRKPTLCTKCKHEVESTTQKKNEKYYYVDTCKHCGYVEETDSSLDEKKEPTQEEIERYEYDKKRFCLTPQQGQRYQHWLESSKRLDVKKEEQEANTEFYDKLKEVKKLNIAGLEKLLKAAIKKSGYADLQISMPSPDRQIIMNFSMRDTEEKREEYDSKKTLEKIIEKTLEDKNWSLMSDSVSYRLGLLSGRIRGYETEEDLQELTKSRMKKKGKHVKLTNSKTKEFSSTFPDDISF